MTAAANDAGEVPVISVVTPFFNAERYLDEAIASVIAQTWSSWELILVDDGSVDGSTALARAAVERRSSSIRYVEHAGHANCGISASRNLGVRHSRGRYIAFLDADDAFLRERLERRIDLLERHADVDAVFGDSIYWRSWADDGANADRDTPRSLGLAPESTFEAGALLPALLRARAFTPATCSIVLRRNAFDRIGGFEESFRGMFEDQAFFYKLFMECRTRMEPGLLERYRQHPDSCCAVATVAGDYREDGPSAARARFLDWFAAYLRRLRPGAWRLRCLVERQRWLERRRSA